MIVCYTVLYLDDSEGSMTFTGYVEMETNTLISGKPTSKNAVRHVGQTSSVNPGLGTALEIWLLPAASTMRLQSKFKVPEARKCKNGGTILLCSHRIKKVAETKLTVTVTVFTENTFTRFFQWWNGVILYLSFL